MIARKIGPLVVAVASLGLGSASLAILRPAPDLTTAVGRHLMAGALANAALAFILFIIAIGPLRRGESWALWAYVPIIAFYGVPMILIDATHVAPERVPRTLAPQIAGITLLIIGLVLSRLRAR